MKALWLFICENLQTSAIVYFTGLFSIGLGPIWFSYAVGRVVNAQIQIIVYGICLPVTAFVFAFARDVRLFYLQVFLVLLAFVWVYIHYPNASADSMLANIAITSRWPVIFSVFIGAIVVPFSPGIHEQRLSR